MQNLGRNAKDKITGFTGVIVAKISYLTGCDQYGITPKVNKEGKTGDTSYFDVNRIEILKGGVKINTNKDVGGVNRDAPQH